MAAQDYGFFPAELSGRVYLAKRIKSKKTMSQDRRVVEDFEAIGIFEAYLRHFCEDNNTDTLEVRNPEGKVIFRATLNTESDEDNCQIANK